MHYFTKVVRCILLISLLLPAQVFATTAGSVWMARTSGTTQWLHCVTWSGSQFVVVGNSGTILTSPNGVTWTPRVSGTTETLYSITWSGSQFVAVGFNGTVLTSPNGVNWTLQPPVTGSYHLFGVTWSGSQFVATANSC